MMNPIKAARESKGLSRTAWSMQIGIGYAQAAAVELGQLKMVPKPWRDGLEAAGFNYDQLNADYLTWRAAMANGGNAA